MKPNILFLVIDSLRSDKCYGNKKTSITPHIDNLRKSGVYFEQAISSVASTGIAMSSIFTGLFPSNMGMSGSNFTVLDSNIPNFIKFFKENGYSVFATAPEIASDFGLICDFENPNMGYDNYFSLFDGLGDQILTKLSSKDFQEPWFFYIHLNDLHYPIKVQENFNHEKYGLSNYEKQVSAIDDWIGKILKKIDLENTLVILTSDHGEYIPIINNGKKIINLESSVTEANLWKLGNKVPENLYPVKKKLSNFLRNTREKIKSSKIDDAELTIYEKRTLMGSRMGTGHHSFDDLLRIPLLFSGFNITDNKIISQQVRHVDIFPTVLELISLELKNVIDGKSLLPLILGKDYAELPTIIENPPNVKEEFTKSIGVRTSNYKFIRDIENLKIIYELYNLKNDPLEEKNIIYQQPDIVKEMEEILLRIRHTSNSDNVDDEKDKIVRENLRKLGYL